MSVKSLEKSPFGWEARQNAGAYESVGKKTACKTNKAFKKACKAEDVEPTPRQYAKWRNKTGRWRR